MGKYAIALAGQVWYNDPGAAPTGAAEKCVTGSTLPYRVHGMAVQHAFRPQDDQSRGLYLCAPSVHPVGTRGSGTPQGGCGRADAESRPGRRIRRPQGMTRNPRRTAATVDGESGGGIPATQIAGQRGPMTHGAVSC